MQEIPESLQHYIPKGKRRNRPWWEYRDLAGTIRRQDGQCLIGKPLLYPSDYIYQVGEEFHYAEEAMAEFDKLHPLPRPKGRFGQVWCVGFNDNEPIVYVVTSNYEASYFANNGIFLLSDPAGEYYASPEKP